MLQFKLELAFHFEKLKVTDFKVTSLAVYQTPSTALFLSNLLTSKIVIFSDTSSINQISDLQPVKEDISNSTLYNRAHYFDFEL